jgi:diguanylate cyclase (GGDEF)-like protein/PAS domain S-box-containing protein
MPFQNNVLGLERMVKNTPPPPDTGADSQPHYSVRAQIAALKAELHATQEHHRNTIELNPQVFWTANAAGEVDDASSRWFSLVGFTREQALGYGWTQAVHPDDLAAAFAQWPVCLRTGEPLDVEYRFRLTDGKYRWFRARAQCTRGPDGQINRWYGTSEDIDDRKRASLALQESESRLRFALESGKMGTWELDFASGRLAASDQFAADFGLAGGHSLADFAKLRAALHPDDTTGFDRAMADFRASETSLETKFRVLWPDASLHWLRITGRLVHDEAGTPTRAIGTSVDITERQLAEARRRRAEDRMVHLANHDPLTDLANHRLLQSSLADAFAARGQSPPEGRVTAALLCIDLNDFKAVNDALGHNVGDGLLLLVARRLTECTPPGDLVARTGGGEFVVLSTALPDRASIERRAAAILQAIAQPTYVTDRLITLSASIGAAFAPDHAADGEQLRKNAGTALARSKSIGHGNYQIFEPEMDARRQAREALKLELQNAIARQELRLRYQPIIDLRSGRIISFEALMRWHHAEKGLVSPADFIPLAEETGWIVKFGRWALHTACAEAATWPDHIGVAVNLSIVQFESGRLEQDVGDALASSGLAPHRLELEVTESLLLRDTAETTGVLTYLRGLGVRISMDDFGTGYASLSSLRRFRFSKIKLDKSLLAGVPDQGEGDAIVQGVIGMAHGLRLPVTAEGVETQAQLTYLRDHGYDHAQGYLFSVPVPPENIPALLRRSWNA